MNDVARRQFILDDRRAFEFGIPKDDDAERAERREHARRCSDLRKRVIRATDLRGNARDLEMRRCYRAACEIDAIDVRFFADRTQEQAIIAWAFCYEGHKAVKKPRKTKFQPIMTREDGTRVLTVLKK
jgi:hypothetical protein